MRLSSDQLVFWQHGFIKLDATIVYTWGLMLFLALGAKLITRRFTADAVVSRWQCALEIIVLNIKKQIEEVGLRRPAKYLGFVGTLFSSSPPPTCSPFSPAMNHPPARFQPRLPLPSAFS